MRTSPIKPRPAFARWRGQSIGSFAGRVSADGARIVPYAGPSEFVVDVPLPAPGTEVVYSLVSDVVVAGAVEFVLRAERVRERAA